MPYTSTQSDTASLAEVIELCIAPSSRAHELLKAKQKELGSSLEAVKIGTVTRRPSEIQQLVMDVETGAFVLCHIHWIHEDAEPAIQFHDALAGVQLRISHNHLPMGMYVPESDKFEPMFREAWQKIVAISHRV